MSFNDNDWSELNQADSFGESDSLPQINLGRGGWHVLQTILSLAAVGGMSFLMAYLTKDIPTRSWWLMGLIFMAPAAVLLSVNYLMESMTSVMTPHYSRRGQAVVALVAMIITFIVGSFANPVYFEGGTTAKNFLFLLDRSSSMHDYDTNYESPKAIENMLDKLGKEDRVGLIIFTDEIIDSVPLAVLDEKQHALISQTLKIDPNGLTDFDITLKTALDMIESASLPEGSITSIVMVTDGEARMLIADDLVHRSLDLNVTVSCVKIAGEIDKTLASVIERTEGQGVSIAEAGLLTEKLGSLIVTSYDVLRDNSSSANMISGFLFMIEGIVLGFTLTLMLSCQKQKRLQLLISPLMGATAFVVCKLTGEAIQPLWMKEAIAFTFFGLVIMRKNSTGFGISKFRENQKEFADKDF